MDKTKSKEQLIMTSFDPTDIIAIIEQGLQKRNQTRSARRTHRLGLSQVWDCPRKLWYTYRDPRSGMNPGPITDGSTLMTFEIGHAVEDIVLQALELGSEGMPDFEIIYRAPQFADFCRRHNLPVPEVHHEEDQIIVKLGDTEGHMDGLVYLEGEIMPVEVKSKAVGAWRSIAKNGVEVAEDHYWMQMQAYIHALQEMWGVEIPGALFIAVQKSGAHGVNPENGKRWAVTYYEFVPKDTDKFMRRYNPVARAMRMDEPPERPFMDVGPCGQCPFLSRCWDEDFNVNPRQRGIISLYES